MRISTVLTVTVLGLVMIWQIGCSSSSQPISSDPPPLVSDHEGHDHAHDGHDHSGQDHSGHDHAHGHSHAAHGPNGGHLLELGEEQFHLEWTHDDESGKLTMYVLDGNAQELVPIAAEKIVIEKTVGDKTNKYELPAVDRQGEMPKSAKFEIVDKALVAALQLVGEGVEATVSVDVNGKPFNTKFTKHEDHHGHKH